MYFLPAVGWEKVIKIRRFSNETAIAGEKDIIAKTILETQYYLRFFPHRPGRGGKNKKCHCLKRFLLYQPIWHTTWHFHAIIIASSKWVIYNLVLR
ncbi:MAG: hypothetical protein LBR79_03145 [Oscillospiraceae bacterium]|nr:hypothetical protein [Oscillospiraceae bacterium]